MINMAATAAARAQIKYQATGIPEQHVKIDGVWFYAPINIDEATGVVHGIRTVFPKTPEGVK